MRKILDLPERICACGCARQFKPARGNQRFFEPACRKKFHAEEMVAVRRVDLEAVFNHFDEPYFGERFGDWWERLKAALEKK